MPPVTAFRLGFVSLHVSDLARARAFYEGKLGLPRTMEFPGEVFYDLAGVALCVHEDPRGECGRLPGGPTGFYLRVADLARAEADLRAAGVPTEPIDERSFALLDPDGNEIVVWKPRTA